MLVSIYFNKSLIYLLIYCIFKVLFYASISNFFSSFLPPLYLIAISKLFSFILYIFQNKISKKIQSIENNNNNINEPILRNEVQRINPPENINLNINRREIHIFQLRKKLISLFLILCGSILEVIFYASFNKMHEKDSIGNKRAYYYLINNKLIFLLLLAFLYLVFYKKFNNVHNVLSLFLIVFSQTIIYIINYKENDQNYKLLLYSFFLNIIYASQNFIEKEINTNNNRNKMSSMLIIGKEGIFELILVIILNVGFKCYFGKNPYSTSLIDVGFTVKIIFMMLCILFSEYMRIDILNKHDPFYICFYEEIIYVFFSIYYYPSKELYYLFFHIIIFISFFIFIEIIELNFCGLNHSTKRYLREREFGNIDEILQGIANISSLSTGSHSDSTNQNNNDLIINEDVVNFDYNNETSIIIGKTENSDSGDLLEDDKNIYNIENKNNINIGDILDEIDESNDDEQKNVFSII